MQANSLPQLQAQLNEQLKEYISADVRGHTVVRLKIQSLILDLLHNRDVADLLVANGTSSCSDWTWSKQLRYYAPRDGQCVVKMVEAELKTEVREDMRAAIITASISPRSPVGMRSRTRRMKAMFVQPPFDSQICSHL